MGAKKAGSQRKEEEGNIKMGRSLMGPTVSSAIGHLAKAMKSNEPLLSTFRGATAYTALRRFIWTFFFVTYFFSACVGKLHTPCICAFADPEEAVLTDKKNKE
jgi:hypothetical protein